MFKKILIILFIATFIINTYCYAITEDKADSYVGKYVIVSYDLGLWGKGATFMGKALEVIEIRETICLRFITFEQKIETVAIQYIDYIREINPFTLEILE